MERIMAHVIFPKCKSKIMQFRQTVIKKQSFAGPVREQKIAGSVREQEIYQTITKTETKTYPQTDQPTR